ncbi:excinuclease ABC subunit UvrA [Candidatus Gracilibacteria bacterium]|nr:excinuclease ABC subunit UvrA [Candidatus Gracilibacteria bacterium]
MSETIEIIGAETHNLKNISVSIPKNTLTVVTGVSGSGKSSLAFDTLYAEGQRRYLESLSTYARTIISDISEATHVREIRGLSPTIAIHQKTVSNNPRSTVGTITEIYDFYRLLFTSIGTPYCINHPNIPLKKDSLKNIVEYVSKFQEGDRFHILTPLPCDENDMNIDYIAKKVTDMGFVRFQIGDTAYSVADELDISLSEKDTVYIVVDRLIKKIDENFDTRVVDSLRIALEKGNGRVSLYVGDTYVHFSLHASCPVCDYQIEDLSISNFSFNSHRGACPSCHGLGSSTTFLEVDITKPELTLAEGCLLPWQAHPYYTLLLEAVCTQEGISMNTSWSLLKEKDRKKILYGVPGSFELSYLGKGNDGKTHKAKYEGLIPNLERRYTEADSAHDAYFKRIANFATEQVCRTCEGYRLQKAYLSIKIGDKNIGELASFSVEKSLNFFKNIVLSKTEEHISKPILKNIIERLEFLSGVGLEYMTLARRAGTLSGGESQRIRLATQIGTRLEGIIYVLDEPSIGLHPRDNDMLIANLKRLAAIGNTVVVVEHDEDIMRESDYIIDIGPGAGVHGGEVLFSGKYEDLLNSSTQTAEYLSMRKSIVRRNPVTKSPKKFIEIYGAVENNLKNINVRIPLECMTVVTGVSGGGKSSLIIDILSNYLMNFFYPSSRQIGRHDRVEGVSNIDKVIIIDQSPIGKTPHSNIATYTGLFTYVREVFAASLDAQKRGFGPGRFSFNTKGGRCEICEGSGTKKIEMHFLPDVYVECESCGGSRYNNETLQVQFKGKNISEVLDMTIEDASAFFVSFPRIKRVLDVLIDVGLGYITLGQSAPTLSGGESQRIKLAFDLAKRSTGQTLYILDEPTTGLHFSDVQKLLDILDRLVEKGNSVLVIEHNLDIIANADAIIDIGPEGGDKGGNLVFAGPRDKILNVENSYTAKALKKYLEKRGK